MKSIGTMVSMVGALLALAGCQSPPELDVERQWSDTMRRLNMFGFYPQSEDILPGDLYLHAPPPDGSPSLPRFNLVRVASYHPDAVLYELQGQQGRRGQPFNRGEDTGSRLDIQPLPTDWTDVERPKTGPIGNTPNCGGYDIGHADDAGCRVRMKRAAIPGLAVGRITNGQLGLTGLFGNFGARLGLARSSETAITISLRNVQDLTLDAWRFDRLHKDHWGSVLDLAWTETLLGGLRELRGELLEAACKGDADTLAREGISVMVINRVIYAGGIEYSFSDNAESAIRTAVDLQSLLPGQPQAPAIPDFPSAGGNGGGGGGGAGTAGAGAGGAAGGDQVVNPQAAAAARLAGLLQGVTGESGGGTRAGVATSFGIGTFGNLSLKENFNRLMAVGAGGVQSYPFHVMLAGSHKLKSPMENLVPGTMADFRFAMASNYCADAFPGRFDPAGLRRAMGIRTPG